MKKITIYFTLIISLFLGMNVAFGQGSETFTNIPTNSSSSYSTRTWTGDNAVSWEAFQARTDQTLTGKAIMFRGKSNSTRFLHNTTVVTGGCGTLSFNYKRVYSGNSTLQVYINGTQVGSNIIVSSTSSSTFTQLVNVSGNITLKIVNITNDKRVIIDDISWTGFPTNATDSDAIAPTIQISAGNISSLVDTSIEAVNVFNIEIQDSGVGDALGTIVTSLKIKPNTTTNTADWTDFIQGLTFHDGVSSITPATINITDAFIDVTFNSGDLVIPDNDSRILTVAAYLNTSNILDNKILSFMVDASDHGFTADSAGSSFITPFPNGNITSSDFMVIVDATELQFTQQPTDVLVNTVMTPSITVNYTDVNGNVDRGYNGLGATATLSATGATFSGSTTVSGTPIQGVMTFNNIEFTTFGSATLTITDTSGITNNTITSNSFTILGTTPCNITTGITIASQDFEDTPATPTLIYTSTNVSPSSGQGAFPVADVFASGLKGVKINSASGTINFGQVDTSKYENIEFSMRVASFSGTSGNGCDSTDYVLIKINDGTSSKEIKIQGNTNNKWSFTSGTGIATTVYDGDNTAVVFQPTTTGNVTTEGYSTIKITNLPAISNLRITIKAYNNSSNEYWILDDAVLTGDQKDFTVWNNTTKTWSNGVPNTTTKAFFDTSYNMAVSGSTTSITACECEIKSGKTVTITNNKYLEIGNDIVNNGTIIVKDKGSLVQINNNQVTGSGIYKIHKTTPTYASYDYTYWSSPLSIETFDNVFTANIAPTEGRRIYSFNTANFSDEFDGSYPQTTGTNDTFDDNNDDWNLVDFSLPMTPGKGYIVMGTGSSFPLTNPLTFTNQTQSVIFDKGIINNGNIDVALSLDKYNTTNMSGNTFNTNANLIGNPYPSAIDITKLSSQIYDATTNPTGILEGTFYFWTHDDPISGANAGPDVYNFNNDDYSTVTIDNAGNFSATASSNQVGTGGITASQFVASGQGFFANAKSAGTMQFTNSMRVSGNNNNFLRPATTIALDRVWLNLTNTNNTIFRQILVGFHDGATDGFANGQDGARMENGSNTDFYSLIPNETNRFAIQNLGTFNDSKTINLGLEIIQDDTYEINIDHVLGVFANNQTVYLEDTITNTIHDLSNNGAYQFTATIGDQIDSRFILRFITTALGIADNNTVNTKLIIAKTNADITLSTSNKSIIKTVRIYNVIGQELGAYNNSSTQMQISIQNIATGTVLLVKATLENGTVITKKVIK